MKMNMTKVERPAQIDIVACLAAEIWREYYVSIITMEQIEYMLNQFQSNSAITGQIEHQGYEYYLFETGDHTPVGYMAIKEEDEKLFLSKFYVHQAYRGQGYASEAIAFLETRCKERNLKSIWLTVNRENASSIAIYEKKGFKKVREQVAQIGNGYVMDDFIMEKTIC